MPKSLRRTHGKMLLAALPVYPDCPVKSSKAEGAKIAISALPLLHSASCRHGVNGSSTNGKFVLMMMMMMMMMSLR